LEGIFDYVKFPAYMKPYAGGGWKNVYRLENKEEFWEKQEQATSYDASGRNCFTEYFRVYCLGCKAV
jgi:hypothetical protein